MDSQDAVAELMAEQPTRKGTRRAPRRFDKTALHGHVHGRLVHRDYAAHFFRWGWIHREIRPVDRVLDVGCGTDLPLLHILSWSSAIVPAFYLGLDLNPLPVQPLRGWAEYRECFDFTGRWEAELPHDFTKAVCLEVLEHMDVADGRALVAGLHGCLASGGTLYLSTPVFDGWRAANHLHEYTVAELTDLLATAGLTVLRRWGTFANLRDLEKVLTPAEREVYDRLAGYYGGHVLSCLFAPYHPDQARNNLWVCRRD